MHIQPLYAAPQHAEQVAMWLWQAFGGETLPLPFFATLVAHSQTPEALPLTFIAVEGETLVGTVGLWRCDLISRQDLFPWMAALYVAPDARGRGIAGQLQQHVIDYARRQHLTLTGFAYELGLNEFAISSPEEYVTKFMIQIDDPC